MLGLKKNPSKLQIPKKKTMKRPNKLDISKTLKKTPKMSTVQKKEPQAVPTEFSIEVGEEECRIIIKGNRKIEGGVEIRLCGGGGGGRVSFNTWLAMCGATNVVTMAKDLILGTAGKEELVSKVETHSQASASTINTIETEHLSTQDLYDTISDLDSILNNGIHERV